MSWCDVPAALPTGGLALCLISEVLRQDKLDDGSLPGAWLSVAIEDVVTVSEIVFRFAPETAGRAFPPGIESCSNRMWGCSWGDLNFHEYSAEGDLQEWVIWQRREGGAAILMGGERIFDDDIVYAGHRPLTADERHHVEACQRMANREQ